MDKAISHLIACEVGDAIEPPTPVVFRTDRAGRFKGAITAVFPTLPGSPCMLLCYTHVGQHGSCSLDWLRDTRPATPQEYAALARELEQIGYNLRIVSRITAGMQKERIAAERRTH